MDEHNSDTALKKATKKIPPHKQTYIVMTILGISFCSQASGIAQENEFYLAELVGMVMLIILIILTEWKGRKLLFVALSVLSILSSANLVYSLHMLGIADCAQASLRIATLALTALVMCEYCEPNMRIVHLITNAVLLRVTYWVTLQCDEIYNGFGDYLQYFKILLGLVCLGSVFTWPESPYWLASKQRFEESKEAFLAVRSKDATDELQALTDTKQRNVSRKMLYTPLLLSLPLLIVFSMDIYESEEDFLIDFTLKREGRIISYVLTNLISTSIAVCFALKTSRRKLIVFYSLISVACFVLTYIWEVYFSATDNFSEMINIITYLSFYVIVMFGASTLYFSAVIEVVPRRYVGLFSACIGLAYFIGRVIYLYMDFANVFFIVVYVAVSSIFAYFLLPEAAGKSLLQIEQEYLPKEEPNP